MSNHLSIDDEEELVAAMTPEERASYAKQHAQKTLAELTIVQMRKAMARTRRRVRDRMKREKRL